MAISGLVHHCLGYAAFQKLSELLGNYGAAEEITLALAATFLLQKMELFLGLHVLGHYAPTVCYIARKRK